MQNHGKGGHSAIYHMARYRDKCIGRCNTYISNYDTQNFPHTFFVAISMPIHEQGISKSAYLRYNTYR